MANRLPSARAAGSDILHVTAIGIYHTSQTELAATLRRLADEAEKGGIGESQPGDIAFHESNPGGGGPCAPTRKTVTFSLVPPRRWPPDDGFADGVPGL